MTSTHIKTEVFYFQTAIIHQLKRLCVPECAYTESMILNFIHVSLYDISLMQNISYQIKRDMTVWKRLGSPQRKQRTWWKNSGNTIYGFGIIVGLISFCTRLYYKYFLRSWMCFRVSFLLKNTKIYNINRWRVLYAVRASVVISPLWQYGWVPAQTLLKNVSHIEAFYSYAILLVAD